MFTVKQLRKVEKGLSYYKRSKDYQPKVYNQIMNATLKGRTSVEIDKKMTDASAARLSKYDFKVTPGDRKQPREIKFVVDWTNLMN